MGSPEKMRSGSNSNKSESATSPAEDTSISPEVKEKVLSMVRDLTTSGYAITIINNERWTPNWGEPANHLELLRSVLDKGLLGLTTVGPKDAKHSSKDVVDKWYYRAREKRTSQLFANIIGRDAYIQPSFASKFAILYDISDFTETIPTGERDYEEKVRKMKAKQFWAADVRGGEFSSKKSSEHMLTRKEALLIRENGFITDLLDVPFPEFLEALKSRGDELRSLGLDPDIIIDKAEKAGDYTSLFGYPHAPDGYVVGRRAAPRKFKGVMWRSPTKEDFPNGNPELEAELKEIQSVFEHVNDEGKKVYLPVYDSEGNLWWPERISHQEIVERQEHQNTTT